MKTLSVEGLLEGSSFAGAKIELLGEVNAGTYEHSERAYHRVFWRYCTLESFNRTIVLLGCKVDHSNLALQVSESHLRKTLPLTSMHAEVAPIGARRRTQPHCYSLLLHHRTTRTSSLQMA
jgi:hypothetical protein